jgi:hypothetical protein
MDFLSLFDPSDTQTDETDTETVSSSDTDSIEKLISADARLPPEPEYGNVEYKLKLNPSKQRLENLITQLKVCTHNSQEFQ